MGWCSGSYLAEDIWRRIKDYIPEDEKQQVAKDIYDKFCDLDADDWENHPNSLWAIAEPIEWLEYVKEMAEGGEQTLEEFLKEMGWDKNNE